MTVNEEHKIVINVIKRNGKKVNFDASKIAISIQKGFDSIEGKYNETDVQNVFQSALKRIKKDYVDKDKIKIEEIQNLIEEELKNKKYDDVYESTKNYRERRNQSRLLFVEEKKMHKFLKTLESLGLKSAHEEDAKRENANVDGDTAMGTMLQYGSTVSKEFAKSYLMKKKFADAHDSGDIHIHDMDFMAMGTTTCLQIDLNKIFKNANHSKLMFGSNYPDNFTKLSIMKFDDIELNDGNLALTVSLHAGEEAITLAKDKLVDKIRVGTSLDAIVETP